MRSNMHAVSDRILLIEDDPNLAEMVKNYLSGAGFRVTLAAKGEAAIALHAREPFDSIVLDLMLPDMDGLDVCRRIRARAQTPILMLTARGEAMDRVIGLEMGADDYLPKPFEPRELLARLRAILRRAKGGQSPDLLRYGRLEIDAAERAVRLDGELRPLTESSVFPVAGAGPARGPRPVARRDHGPLEERAARGVRPLDRCAHLAHSRRDRGRSEKAAPCDHCARRRVRLCQGTGLSGRMRRLYQKIYLTIIASLVLVVLVAGAVWRFGAQYSPANQAFEIAGEVAAAVLPPADAPRLHAATGH